MGFLEAIVVVYIRELYYPLGFQFPLKELPPHIIIIEWIREISTLLMLGTVAWVSGKIFLKRLSVFLFIFGIWDIVYYIGLKIFLDWPESLLTWDILFLIPITWVGPVLAPVLCSLLMIITGLLFDFIGLKTNLSRLKTVELLVMAVGAAIIYYTYTVDFGMILKKGRFLSDFSNLPSNPDFLAILTNWVPDSFQWEIFSVGFVSICIGLFMIIKRAIR